MCRVRAHPRYNQRRDIIQTELSAVATIATARRTNSLLVWRFAVGGALIVAWLFLIPFSPAMPAFGLDQSLEYALNEAVGQGYVFGRDVISRSAPSHPSTGNYIAPQPTQ